MKKFRAQIIFNIFTLILVVIPALSPANLCFASEEEGPTADEEIQRKLNELLHQPDSVLTKMRTFKQQDEVTPEAQEKKTEVPLSSVPSHDLSVKIYPASSFSGRFKALAVTVENHTDKTLVVDGDKAALLNTLSIATPRASVKSADTGDFADRGSGSQALSAITSAIPCATQAAIDAVGKPPTTFTGKFTSDVKATVTAALTVGAVQTAETIVKERGPIKERYEWDEQRREREDSRFGKRLLYPGDKSDGMIYFNSDVSFGSKSLAIPVASFYDQSDQTCVNVAIDFSSLESIERLERIKLPKASVSNQSENQNQTNYQPNSAYPSIKDQEKRD